MVKYSSPLIDHTSWTGVQTHCPCLPSSLAQAAAPERASTELRAEICRSPLPRLNILVVTLHFRAVDVLLFLRNEMQLGTLLSGMWANDETKLSL